MKSALLALLLLMPASAQEAGGRESITFLLGEDEDPALPMFRLAEAHFRRDPAEHTDHVIPHLRSLREVRDYLDEHPCGNGRPWGLINLVAHGKAGLLDVPTVPEGPKVTAVALGSLLRQGAFPPLPDRQVDSHTEIRLHGCAVGRDRALLQSVSEAFGGDDAERPLVRASKWHTCFRPGVPEKGLPSRYLCQDWDLVYQPGARPDDAALATRFRHRNPGVDLDAADALTRDTARFHGDAFSYETPLRFTWTVAYAGAEAPPCPPGPGGLRKWLLTQDGFQRSLHAAGLSFEELQWEVHPTRVKWNGSEFPALAAHGEARAMHLLRGLKGEGSDPQSAWEDERFYTTVR